MGWYVHIHVCFACQHNEPVADLARRHLPGVNGDGTQEAVWFLEDLAKRVGQNPGPKGGLSLWGMVGNYTNGDRFVECLRPFWGDLLRQEVGGICQHERVLVFVENEQSKAAQAFEIFLAEDDEARAAVEVKRHVDLPFSFRQM